MGGNRLTEQGFVLEQENSHAATSNVELGTRQLGGRVFEPSHSCQHTFSFVL
jgi:hypothetical protein